MLGLHVDRRQYPAGKHAAEEPEAADAGTGAYLDHRAGAAGRREQAQRGPGAGRDGCQTHLLSQRPGHLHGPVLREVRLSEVDGLHG